MLFFCKNITRIIILVSIWDEITLHFFFNFFAQHAYDNHPGFCQWHATSFRQIRDTTRCPRIDMDSEAHHYCATIQAGPLSETGGIESIGAGYDI